MTQIRERIPHQEILMSKRFLHLPEWRMLTKEQNFLKHTSIVGVLTFNFFRKSLIAIAFTGNRMDFGAEIIAGAQLTPWGFVRMDILTTLWRSTKNKLILAHPYLQFEKTSFIQHSFSYHSEWLLAVVSLHSKRMKTFEHKNFPNDANKTKSIILIGQSKLKKEKT